MRTLVYEHILAQKHLYLININKASLIILNKMIKCKPKTINAINRLRPLAISETIANMFERILLHHIDVNKKTTKKTTKT